MARDINLLPEDIDSEVKGEEKKKFSTLLSLLILLVVGLIAAGLFAYQMMKRSDLENLNKLIGSKERAVGDLVEVEGTVRALDIRLTRLSQVFNSSPDNAKIVQNLLSLINKEVSITEVDLGSGTLTVGGTANSSQGFNEFLTNLLDKSNGAKFFKSPILRSFSKSADKEGYLFSIEMSPILTEEESESPKAVSFKP